MIAGIPVPGDLNDVTPRAMIAFLPAQSPVAAQYSASVGAEVLVQLDEIPAG